MTYEELKDQVQLISDELEYYHISCGVKGYNYNEDITIWISIKADSVRRGIGYEQKTNLTSLTKEDVNNLIFGILGSLFRLRVYPPDKSNGILVGEYDNVNKVLDNGTSK